MSSGCLGCLWLGGDGDCLAEAQAETSLVWLVHESSHGFELEGGGVVTPSLEARLRHGGDDTGAGIEERGGMRYANPTSWLAVEAPTRGLMEHEDNRLPRVGFDQVSAARSRRRGLRTLAQVHARVGADADTGGPARGRE